ncbi:MAG: trypsin-like peptidase domain-containing protein [Phycisphaerae bacterium]|nr:trypsin-like peptidase domain-containing protein [Phycisphaerae bacterium]
MKRTLVLVLLGLGGMLGGCEEPESIEADAAKRPGFREIVKSAKSKVFPAVVYIKSLRESHEMGKKITSAVLGSGVIISPTGEVISNWHVVDKSVELRCLLSDGRYFDAKVIGTDKDTDLALLQLQLPKNTKPLPFAKLGDSSVLKEGDFVMAMGAPYGLNRSVSIGIISCTRRYLRRTSEYSLWLQTDASINPGNSGGPLVDTHGKIIGINTRGGAGMGFAVPGKNVAFIIDQLRKFKKVNWSWTGLQLQPLKNFNKNIYFKGDKGVIVADTDPESPARRAGIRKEDRLLSVNGKALNALHDEDLPAVRRTLGLLAKKKPAKVVLQRNGKQLTIELTPREKGKVEGEELDCPRWDMTVKAINQFDNKNLYFYKKKGVFIYGIKYPGNASNAGLNEQDIILKIGKEKVTSLEDLKKIHAKAIKNIKKKHRIPFTVLRNGMNRQLILDFQRDYEKE